ARANLAAAGVGVTVARGDGTLGLPDHAPFAGIAVAAAAPSIPPALYEQLVPGGRLVLPLGTRTEQWLTVVERSTTGPRLEAMLPARFVPLVGTQGFQQHGFTTDPP